MIEFEKASIDIEKCTKCKLCITTCARHIYSFESDNLKISKNFDEKCNECGHCVAICPSRVFNLKYHAPEDIKSIPSNDYLPTFEQLSNIVKKRRSIRIYQDKSVPKDIIEKIINLARYAPTAVNTESVYFTVVQDPNLLEKFSQDMNLSVENFVKKIDDPEGRASLESVLPGDLMRKATEAVVSMKRHLKEIATGKEVWRWNTEIIIIHSPKKVPNLEENCSLAAMLIMLAAETLGLGTCSLGYVMTFLNQFRPVAKIVKIPRNHKVCYVVAIGYPKVKYSYIPCRKPLKVKWL